MLYWWPGSLGFLCFFGLGLVFFRYPGFQNDELLFAATVFRRSASVYILPLGRGLPLMALSYLGTLKSWVWGPLLRHTISEASVRLPAVFLGALTIFLTYQLVTKMHSRRAAIVATAILATDATFFLTTCFDWGPVAFQHLFVVTGLLLALGFAESGGRWSLFFAFLAFGLGLWDKALFLWIFLGLVAGAALIYPREVFRRMSTRNLAVALLGLMLGASPLIVYNIARPMETFRSSSHFVFNEFGGKWRVLQATFGGAALEGYLTNLEPPPVPGGPGSSSAAKTGAEEGVGRDPRGSPDITRSVLRNLIEKCSFRLHSLTGDHPSGYEEEAVVVALLLLPFLLFIPRLHKPRLHKPRLHKPRLHKPRLHKARRSLLFLLIAFFVAWFQMAITQNAGAALHHTILLWPLPAMFLGIAFAEASLAAGRAGLWLLILSTVVIAGSNLAVLNEYLYTFIRNGAGGTWTDAIGPLVRDIVAAQPSRVVVYDWGIFQPVEVITRERILPQWGDDPLFPPSINEEERKFRMEKLEDPGAIWVGHTDGYEQFSGINARVVAGARAVGFEKMPLFVVNDSHGRPMFQVFRWRRVGERPLAAQE